MSGSMYFSTGSEVFAAANAFSINKMPASADAALAQAADEKAAPNTTSARVPSLLVFTCCPRVCQINAAFNIMSRPIQYSTGRASFDLDLKFYRHIENVCLSI